MAKDERWVNSYIKKREKNWLNTKEWARIIKRTIGPDPLSSCM